MLTPPARRAARYAHATVPKGRAETTLVSKRTVRRVYWLTEQYWWLTPKYLGYLNPRLSDAAEQITTDYEENAEFIKLFLPAGEIDIVVGMPLTEQPFELVSHAGREIKVETCAEIIAKKMWHRGDRAKARDLYDLCAVAEVEPEAIDHAAPFLARHGAAFLAQLQERAEFVEAEVGAIDAIGIRRSFKACLAQARDIIVPLLTNAPG